MFGLKTKKREDKRKKVNDAAEPAYISEIEKESLKLQVLVEQSKQEAEEHYLKLPELADFHEVDQQVDSLRRAAVTMSKTIAQTYAISDELSARCKDIEKQRKKRRVVPYAPANTTIDLYEQESSHFARGMNPYKLLLVCFIGSFVGVVVELLWCLLRNGYLESRSGLVYGPFNLLYGAGAVALTACLYKFRNNGAWVSFLGGMLVGSVVEYACSFGQELLFGSRSWDYSEVPFNLNGRI